MSPMRSLLLGVFLVPALTLLGCEPAASTPAVASPTDVAVPKAAPTSTADPSMTLERAANSGKVDRVGPNDGALQPDGVEDLVFTSSVEGPVAALFLVSVDEKNMPTGQFQADTLITNQERPAELGGMRGGTTSGMGVFEGARMWNASDGSLTLATSVRRTLTLYVAKALELQPGMRLRLYVLRPDKTLIAGATLAN